MLEVLLSWCGLVSCGNHSCLPTDFYNPLPVYSALGYYRASACRDLCCARFPTTAPLCHTCNSSPVLPPMPVPHPLHASLHTRPSRLSRPWPNQAVLKNLLLYPIKLRNNIIPHGHFRYLFCPGRSTPFMSHLPQFYVISGKPEASEMAGTCFKCQPH